MIELLYFLDQHGCAKNQVDGELILSAMAGLGWTMTGEPEKADLVIVNSCGFIESAKKESIDAVITARVSCPRAKVLLAGCLAERYADELAEGLQEADAFFGNGDLSRLPEIIKLLFPESSGVDPLGSGTAAASRDAVGADAESQRAPVVRPPQVGVCAGSRPVLLSFPRSAYVKVTEGCDNRCSFCAIPLIRGNLRSRTIDEIVSECRDLVGRGIFEINLIGQDLSSYGRGSGDDVGALPGGASPLSVVLRALSGLKGDFRVRLLYLHPDHFPRDILPVMSADVRFLPYFDIPFQSADADLLVRMNRKGSADSYRSLVGDIRSAFADAGSPYGKVALRTTFLTGFPGETDEAFETTARFLADIRSMWSGAFSWSREDGTPAAEFKKRVPKKTAKIRLDTLREIQIRITPEELEFFIGKTVEVLVEELVQESGEDSVSRPGPDGETSPDAMIPASRLALGRAWFQAPEVDGSTVLQFEDNQLDRDGKPIGPGSVVSAVIMGVNGVDVEAVVR